MKVPHPIPYQGSKRGLAGRILASFPQGIETLVEPFAGSGAITLAAATRRLAKRYLLNDLNAPLMALWRMIIEQPQKLANQYEAVWKAQHGDRRGYYDKIRGEFNRTGRPHHFLYLLARCVKGAVRYNSNGEFNQSPDNRRTGALPATMRDQILGASDLLQGKTECRSEDYRCIVERVSQRDLVYLDPPYQGVSHERDPRYLKGVPFAEFVEVLERLNRQQISYLVSYDGRTGEKVHGRPLPPHLRLHHLVLVAGRSSQQTLLGQAKVTYESLYLSPALSQRLEASLTYWNRPTEPLALLEATG
jgi:DNA adenine methylase